MSVPCLSKAAAVEFGAILRFMKKKKIEKQSTFQRRYTHMANKHVKILDSH